MLSSFTCSLSIEIVVTKPIGMVCIKYSMNNRNIFNQSPFKLVLAKINSFFTTDLVGSSSCFGKVMLTQKEFSKAIKIKHTHIHTHIKISYYKNSSLPFRRAFALLLSSYTDGQRRVLKTTQIVWTSPNSTYQTKATISTNKSTRESESINNITIHTKYVHSSLDHEVFYLMHATAATCTFPFLKKKKSNKNKI
ncbi:hypothetical protein AGLY_004419 [Aphis glycines]|uniref:Uncharacterized protein n=1 Tax=Aphis glycines TaxID=307491 RepID=A0A6G0TYI7_APHGL|nr:hypothetical protein AGLY_004419 [Aphis glycines]